VRRFTQVVLFATAFLFTSISWAGAPPGEWVTVSLSQIELSPSEGWFVPAGMWFASPTPYQTQFNCSNSRYISILDATLASRALSIALYAKSAGDSVKVYVAGCDNRGVLIGLSAMLVD